jgi:HD-GYP domain-containing protein (c-di-GMP phosphodiesterase class II)
LVKAIEDLDLFVCLGINPPSGDYPDRHSLHVAMLAASVGVNMGWDVATLLELGVGCLLHDIGMLRVPHRIYRDDRIVDDGEFGEIARHPIHTFDLLVNDLGSVPRTSQMVAYQIHERCDGSGYPRRRKGALIHEVAKVAAVADVYVALVSSRPHRPALMPYYAVSHLVYGVKNGAFDAVAVRGFLKTVSLFPIGSYLELRDGRKGRVIRANPVEFGKPVIEVWLPSELDASPTILDLSATTEVMIKGPLPRLAA